METVKKRCNHCGGETFMSIRILRTGPHYAEYRCIPCNGHNGFLKKPENEHKRPPNKYTAAKLGIDHCQICLRAKSELIAHEVLEVHHVIAVSDGGEDTIGNIQVVCTPCHRMIHFNRTYFRRASGEY